MSLQHTSDFGIFKINEIDKLYDHFKNGEAYRELCLLGEEYFSSKVKARRWKNEEEDKDFIYDILRSIGVFPAPEIEFNMGVSEEHSVFNSMDGVDINGTIVLRNYTNKLFKLRVINYSVSSPIIKIDRISYEENQKYGDTIIHFSILIGRNTKREDYFERVYIVTNHSTYIYNISMICEDGINYSDSVGIKTIDEFYYLYSRDFEKAVSCYISERFGDWLKENKYHEELRVYNRLGMERNAGISMQNFLQILGYDVLPSIDARYLDGTLVINNTGRGLLYGSIRCPAEVETDKYEWETENGKALINLRGKGIISILSNGGCKKIFIDDANTLQMPILKKERKILLDRLLKNCQVVKGKADLPKVSVDNDFVSAYVNDEYDIRIKRNISLLDLIIKKLKKLETHSNMRIIYSDIIYYYKIILV